MFGSLESLERSHVQTEQSRGRKNNPVCPFKSCGEKPLLRLCRTRSGWYPYGGRCWPFSRVPELPEERDFALFGIFDGHGGKQAPLFSPTLL